MIVRELPDYGVAVAQVPVAPALDLEEFLGRREWQTKNRPPAARLSMLRQGMRFLDLATEGRVIAQRTLEKGELGVDLEAIRAYLLLYAAYEHNPELREHDFDNVLDRTQAVVTRLLDLLESTGRAIHPPADSDIEIARQLFLSLSTVPLEAAE